MMILVTGGSGSGKSAFAEDCVIACGEMSRVYIATMYPFDEESRKRVKRHRDMRFGKGFDTVECYTGLSEVRVPKGCTVLLECMSNLVANEIFREDGAHENTEAEILKVLQDPGASGRVDKGKHEVHVLLFSFYRYGDRTGISWGCMACQLSGI